MIFDKLLLKWVHEMPLCDHEMAGYAWSLFKLWKKYDNFDVKI